MTTVVWAPEPHHLDAPHTSTVCHVTTRYNDATTTISGPNDAYRVVWALGECFFFNYSLSFILTAIYHRVSNVPKRRDQQQGSRHVSSPYRCHVTHHHYPTSRAMPLPCHTKPPPPENTHRARTTVVLPSFGPNKYFFIFVFIDIFIDIHVDIFIGIVNVIN